MGLARGRKGAEIPPSGLLVKDKSRCYNGSDGGRAGVDIWDLQAEGGEPSGRGLTAGVRLCVGSWVGVAAPHDEGDTRSVAFRGRSALRGTEFGTEPAKDTGAASRLVAGAGVGARRRTSS